MRFENHLNPNRLFAAADFLLAQSERSAHADPQRATASGLELDLQVRAFTLAELREAHELLVRMGFRCQAGKASR